MSLKLAAVPGVRAARGFTMIEVLVTLVIMMFGLLGIAGLILKGQKAGSEAYQRNQALIMAMDMAEKMKTNRLPGGALNAATYITGNGHGMPLGVASIPVPVLCMNVVTGCTPAEVVDYDIVTWNNLLVGTQESTAAANVGGIVHALGCIEQPIPNGPVRISVAWQGDMDTGSAPVTTCGGNFTAAAYGSQGRIRVVAIDIL